MVALEIKVNGPHPVNCNCSYCWHVRNCQPNWHNDGGSDCRSMGYYYPDALGGVRINSGENSAKSYADSGNVRVMSEREERTKRLADEHVKSLNAARMSSYQIEEFA